eukprot:1295425-Amphidinium_carterae.1
MSAVASLFQHAPQVYAHSNQRPVARCHPTATAVRGFELFALIPHVFTFEALTIATCNTLAQRKLKTRQSSSTHSEEDGALISTSSSINGAKFPKNQACCKKQKC